VSCPFDVAITPALSTRAITAVTGVPSDQLVWRDGERWNARMLAAAYIGLHWVWDERKEE
jgi:hypothetical protein